MKFVPLVIPVLLIALLVYSAMKKVKIYDSFAAGAGRALPIVFSLFPYLVTIFIMTELFRLSGLSDVLITFLAHVFDFLGIPPEIAPLVILKPFSGGGSLALLTEIFEKYGVDSYVSLCASVVYGSSETTFYTLSVYFRKTRVKYTKKIIPAAIICDIV